jgi:tetratricopeptide (TPR) repeat protein
MLYAYKAAFIGFKIGISPYKAPFIGPESLKFAQMSVKLDSTNALGYIQLGNISFYSPVVFGGSKTTALNHYLKALELMEKNPARIVENWNYLNLYVTLINTYFELEKYEQAKTYSLRA